MRGAPLSKAAGRQRYTHHLSPLSLSSSPSLYFPHTSPSSLLFHHQTQERDTIRLKREAKANGGFYVEPEAKLAYVVRIRGLNKIHPKVGMMRGGLLVTKCGTESVCGREGVLWSVKGA